VNAEVVTKQCPRCNAEKPTEHFDSTGYCRACRRKGAIVLRVPELERDVVFPDLAMLFLFALHASFPAGKATGSLRVVDVGACVGGFTLAGLLNFPGSTFDVIEPYKPYHAYLDHNLGDRDNVTVHHVAASDKAQKLTMSLSERFSKLGQASVYGAGIDAESVDAVPLDDLIQGRVDVLKIDVEGYEYNVLQGAQRILNEWHPSVLIEAKDTHQRRAGHTVQELMKFFLDLGYAVPEAFGNDYWFQWEGA
jgi:FkbM family methyltransferase